MTVTLEINGTKVQVDDAFRSMSPEDQQKTVEEIATQLGAKRPKTGMVEQGMSGVNEGIGQFLGFPVDAATSAINLGVSGANRVLGSEIPKIENPVMGSDWINNLQSGAGTISEVDPQTTAQKYARRIGQEAGFGVPAALTGAAIPGFGAAARANMPAYMATSLAGDVGSGAAGQTAQMALPENKIAQIAASLLGGAGGSMMFAKALPKYAPGPTLEAEKARASGLWDNVNASDARLTDQATDDLRASVRGALPTSQLAPDAYPNAFKLSERLDTVQNPTIAEVGDTRRIIGDAVAGNPNESRVGVDMKKAINDYLGSLDQSKLTGGDASVVDDLAEATKTTARVKRAEAVLNKEMRGESRAATSGTGGNEVNAKRQNIRSLLDIERDPTLKARRQGFTKDEVALMEDIVFGTPGGNAARALGRLSPTSGALSQILTGWGGAAGLASGMATGNPLGALPAAAGGVGMVAKALAEKSVNNKIDMLTKVILNGGNLKPSSAAKAAKAAVIQQLLSGSLSGAQ